MSSFKKIARYALLGSLSYNLSITAYAQQVILRLIHDKTGEPVVDAHVSVSAIDVTRPVTYHISNAEGVILLDTVGTYLLTISHTSYQYYHDTVQVSMPETEIRLKPLLLTIDEVVVTASFSPVTSGRSLYNVVVIKEESIQRRGAVHLRDVLRQQLNMRLNQDGVLGTGLTLQGLGGQQVKILVDGIPVIGRVNGNIDIGQLTLNDAERIEIIDGPVSMQYGTNALGGVVNIITKNTTEKRSLRLNTYYESVGQYNIDGSIGVRNERHLVRLSGGRYFFDGYSDPDTSRAKQWDPKEQYFGTLKYQYQAGDIQLGYTSSMFREKIENRGERRPLLYLNAFDDYYHTLRLDNAITVKGKIFQHHFLDQVVAYNFFQRRKNTYLKDLTTLEMIMTTNAEDQDTSRFSNLLARGVIVRDNRQHWFNYQIGYDINYETANTRRISGKIRSIGDYALFFSCILQPIKSLILQPGARWSYNTAYRAPLSPVLNIRWEPIDRLIVRASYARGFRAPDLKELYFHFVDINHHILGNPNLKAETSHAINLNMQHSSLLREHHALKVQTALFYNRINNNIFLVITDFLTNTAQHINIGRYHTAGGQVLMSYQLDQQLHVSVGYNYTGRKFEHDSISSTFLFTPEWATEINYTLPRIGINFSLFNKWNGRLTTLTLLENKLSIQELAPFHTLDFSVSRYFWNNRLQIMAGGKNMMGVTNISARGYASGFHGGTADTAMAGWGRTAFVSLRFNFTKS